MANKPDTGVGCAASQARPGSRPGEGARARAQGERRSAARPRTAMPWCAGKCVQKEGRGAGAGAAAAPLCTPGRAAEHHDTPQPAWRAGGRAEPRSLGRRWRCRARARAPARAPAPVPADCRRAVVLVVRDCVCDPGCRIRPPLAVLAPEPVEERGHHAVAVAQGDLGAVGRHRPRARAREHPPGPRAPAAGAAARQPVPRNEVRQARRRSVPASVTHPPARPPAPRWPTCARERARGAADRPLRTPVNNDSGHFQFPFFYFLFFSFPHRTRRMRSVQLLASCCEHSGLRRPMSPCALRSSFLSFA